MGEDGIWHTAPTYDYTFSVDPSAPGYMNRHSMTINNKNADIERSDLLELAKWYNIKGADAIIEKVISVLGNYEQYAETVGVSPYWTHKIKEEIGYRIDNMTEISHHKGLGR